ncbi:MAG TPA: GNAT family N-acetyltransferase [Kiloniellaceae bacterium]|nr:GNAT family N-acetyltransferase [Kiloniellaceae bacterium]
MPHMLDLRSPLKEELTAASELCMRSKAHWGYSAAFMAACEAELALNEDDLDRDAVAVAVDDRKLVGLAQVSCDETGCFLEKLFVDPASMGQGVGRKLFQWSLGAALRFGATEMIVEADPDAVPFYKAMGCEAAGEVPSGSIPGRSLPRLIHRLRSKTP